MANSGDREAPGRTNPTSLSEWQRRKFAHEAARMTERCLADLEALRQERDGLLQERARLESTRGFRVARALSTAASSGLAGWLRLPGALWRALAGAAADGAPVVSTAAVPEPIRLPSGPTGSSLRIAAIIDPFTELGLAGECELFLPSPGGALAELQAFAPDLLLVESAWEGNRGRWTNLLGHDSPALHALLQACRSLGVPTIFWNKEDPSHFGHFLELGKLFDHLLTTDSDCLARYANEGLRPDAGVMAFACQPRVHHPVDAAGRRDGLLFAGSYYHRYPARMQAFERLMDAVPEDLPVTIFDRNEGRDDPEFAFPVQYRPLVRGSLPPGDMPATYRSFTWALNLNSITGSPTMVSRRIFELLACGTLVASNHADALGVLPPGTILVDPDRQAWKALRADPLAQARMQVCGLRAVMSSHTWGHRIDQLARIAGKPGGLKPLPRVCVLAKADDDEQAGRLVRDFAGQQGVDARLVLVVPKHGMRATESDPPGVQRVADPAQGVAPAEGEAICVWSAEDAHGPRHLLDLALATRYFPARAVGRARNGEPFHRTVAELPWRGSMAMPGASIAGRDVGAWFDAAAAGPIVGDGLLRIDAFNFEEGGRGDLSTHHRDAG